jgi:hypothetical protein
MRLLVALTWYRRYTRDAIHVTNIVSTLFKDKFTPNLNLVLISQMDNTVTDPWSVAVDTNGESPPGELLNSFVAVGLWTTIRMRPVFTVVTA